MHQESGGLYGQTSTDGTTAITYTFAGGEDRFYVVAMGGGGNENVSGTIDLGSGPVDITAYFQSRADVTSFIDGYNSGAAADGSQDVTLMQMQTALSSSLTWGATIIEAAPDGADGFWPPPGPTGYSGNSLVHDSGGAGSNSGLALLYSITPVPEPSSVLLGGLGMLALLRRRRY